MKNHWYCHVEGQDYGPFTWEQLRSMAAEGRIVSNSSVRRDIDQQWFQAAQVPGLLPKSPAAAKKNGAGSSANNKSPAATRNSDSGLMAAVGSDPPKSSAAIKQPKKVTSHSSGNIPVGSVPLGKPVATPPVVAQAAPTGVAVVQAAAPAFTFSVATAPPPAKSNEQHEPAQKGSSPLLIVGLLGGVVALVALIGVGVLIYSLTRPAITPEDQVASALEQEMQSALEAMAKDLQKNPPSELNPPGVTDLQPNAPSVGSPPTSTSSAAPDAIAKVLKSIPDSSWKDVTQLRAIELNKLKLSVAAAWLAVDEAGTRVDSAPGSTAKYVFIQLRVTNVAPVVRKYKSWNVAGGTSVALTDQTSAFLGLVEPTSTPTADRLTAVDIQPGQNVTDTLVFAAPGGSVEKLRLALAKSAFAENAKFKTGSHFALEIPLEVLLAGGPSSDFANAAQEPIAANRASTLQPSVVPPAIIEPQSAPPLPPEGDKSAAPAAAPPPKGTRPPTREELNKQFEELSKKEGQSEPKKGEAQK